MATEENICKLPPGSWDSHIHVVDNKFPLHPNRPYTPAEANLDNLLTFERHIGISHICIIQITAYQTDNSCLVDTLKRLNGKGRGVAVVNIDTITDATLDDFHSVGVRGLRFNLHTTSQTISKELFVREIWKYADKIRRLNWVIQLFVTLDQIALVADEIPKLGVDVVCDHIGAPPEPLTAPQDQRGYSELMNLLRKKQIFVKLSGIYRFNGEKMPRLEEYIKEILRDARTQVVWGSDRPHPGGAEWNTMEDDRWKMQKYRKVDIPDFVAKCKEWCGQDEETIRMIFVDNPRRLWRYDGND